jgi:hypothetical protein
VRQTAATVQRSNRQSSASGYFATTIGSQADQLPSGWENSACAIRPTVWQRHSCLIILVLSSMKQDVD